MDGDVLVVTQKVVSKAEGRLVAIDADDPAAKRELVERESVRIVRRRDELLITETRHGFICANAGIDLGIPEDVKERALAYMVVGSTCCTGAASRWGW